jgi:hypothetical protein
MLKRIAQYIRHYLPITISRKHIVVFLILFGACSVVLFGFGTQTAQALGLDDVADGILKVLTHVALFFARLCMAMAIFFLRFFIQLGAYNGFLDAPIVRLGWVMLRDIANMFFVVALLVIAFATILGRESYEWKKAMVKLVLVAIVVNFSLLICGVVLDAAHVFTVTFINAIAPVAAGNLITMFNFGQMQSIITNSGGGQGGDLDLALFGGAAIALFFSALAALTIGAYCAILLARMVAIWSLLIFSPLAFVLSVLPATENYFEEWKSEFTKNVLSAPIAVFFLWLAFATMGANSAVEHMNQYSSGHKIEDVSTQANAAGDSVAGGIGAEAAGTNTNSVSINAASTWAAMAGFLVAMAFLLKGIEQVQSLGVAGSGWLDSAQSFAKNVATIGSGVALGGWMLGKGRDLSVNSGKNLGLGITTKLGLAQAWKRNITGKGFFSDMAQKAEGRLSVIDDEKAAKEKKNVAIGRRDAPLLDRSVFDKGLDGKRKTPIQRLVEQQLLAEKEEHKTHGDEEQTKANTDLAMRQGKYGQKLAQDLKDASHHDLVIKMDQDRLDTFKNKQTAEDRKHLAEHDKNYGELQKEKAQAETAEGLATAAESLQSASAKLEEMKKPGGKFEKMQLEKLRAETREHAASETEKEIATDVKQGVYNGSDDKLKHELEHAKEHEETVSLKEKLLSDTEKKLAAQYRLGAQKSDLGISTRKVSFDAGMADEEANAYATAQENDLIKAQRIEQDEAFKNAKAAILGKRKERELNPEELRQVYQQAAQGLSLYQTQWQKMLQSESEDDAKVAREGIAGLYDMQISLAEGREYEKIVRDATASLLKTKRQEITTKKHSGKTYDDLSELEKQSIDGEALDSITDQERAFAVRDLLVNDKTQEVRRGMVRYASDRYVADQNKMVAKAKGEKENIAAFAKDIVKHEEGKVSFEADAILRAKAEDYIKDFSHLAYEQRVEVYKKLYGNIKSLRGKKDLSDDQKKLLENSVQDMRKLQASLQADFSDSIPSLYLELEKDTQTTGLNESDKLQLINLAAASGFTLDELSDKDSGQEKIQKAEEFIKKNTKEKYAAMQRAQQISMDRGALSKGNVEAYGAFQEAYDDAGVRRVVMSQRIDAGPIKGAGTYSSGKSDSGSAIRKGNAAANIAKSLQARKIAAARTLVSLASVNGSAQADGILEGMEDLYHSVVKNIVSTQMDPANIRLLFGDSYMGRVVEESDKAEFVFASEKARNDALSLIQEKVRTIGANDITPALRKQHIEDLKVILKSMFGNTYKNSLSDDDTIKNVGVDIQNATEETLSEVLNTWLNYAKRPKKDKSGKIVKNAKGDMETEALDGRFADEVKIIIENNTLGKSGSKTPAAGSPPPVPPDTSPDPAGDEDIGSDDSPPEQT